VAPNRTVGLLDFVVQEKITEATLLSFLAPQSQEDFFWHRLTRVVLEKGLQNGCVSVWLCAYEIYWEMLNGFEQNSQGRHVRSLAATSLKAKVTRDKKWHFLCMLPMSVARSSSGMLTTGRIAYWREG